MPSVFATKTKQQLLQALQGTGLSQQHAPEFLDWLFDTMAPAVDAAGEAGAAPYTIRVFADITAMKAADVSEIPDKTVVFCEDEVQLFAYDADSEADEAAGPPASLIEPDEGAGRYVALTIGDINTLQSAVDQLMRDKTATIVHTATYAVEDLSAGADISARKVFYAPMPCTVKALRLRPRGNPAGVDDSNTSAVVVTKTGGNTVGSKTYNTANQPPSGNTLDALTLTGTGADLQLATGDELLLAITNGTTADLAAFDLLVEYSPNLPALE